MKKKILIALFFLMFIGCKFFKNADKSYTEGMEFLEKKDYNSAIANLKTSVEINPKEEKYHKGLIKAYNEAYKSIYSEQYIKGILESNSNAIENFPDELSYRIDRGFQYCNSTLKDYEKGITDLSFVIEKEPKNSNHYHIRSKCYMGASKYQESLKDLNQALSLDPKNIAYIQSKAELYEKMKDLDKAIEEYKNLSNLLKINPWPLIDIGNLYIAKKEYEQAIESFQAFISNYENLPEISKSEIDKDDVARSYYGIAKASLEMGERKDVTCEFYEIAKRIPDSRSSIYSELDEACAP
jgi:tetratricopeptide (TPR) repeat protein